MCHDPTVFCSWTWPLGPYLLSVLGQLQLDRHTPGATPHLPTPPPRFATPCLHTPWLQFTHTFYFWFTPHTATPFTTHPCPFAGAKNTPARHTAHCTPHCTQWRILSTWAAVAGRRQAWTHNSMARKWHKQTCGMGSLPAAYLISLNAKYGWPARSGGGDKRASRLAAVWA